VLQSQSTEDGKLVLTFAHVGDGIVSADGEALRWFAVAGDDGKFFWAQAEILAKDRIALRSEQVNSPRYVRYAWQDNPVGVNFYNSAGLPASPFRTDGQDSNAFKTF
jgi:sialate O-acetylesterase